MHRLLKLALEINDGHIEVLAHLKNCVDAVLAAVKRKALVGQRLAEAKALLPRGEWMSWLENYCPGIEQRTANRYMAFANLWPALAPRLEEAANWTGLSNAGRLQLIWRMLSAAATHDQGEVEVQAAVPDLVKPSAVLRWAEWLAVRAERIQLSDIGSEDRAALRASLEPAVKLYEALGQ